VLGRLQICVSIRQTSFREHIRLDLYWRRPTGLACAIEAKRAGLRPLVVDKGVLCNSLYHYPVNMVFFTTPELLEIGDLPLTSPQKSQTAWKRLSTIENVRNTFSWNCGWDIAWKTSRAATGNSSYMLATSRGPPQNSKQKKSSSRQGITTCRIAWASRRRPAACLSLLHRTAPVLAAGCSRHWRQEFSG